MSNLNIQLDIQRLTPPHSEPFYEDKLNGSHSNVDISNLISGPESPDSDERGSSPPGQSRSASAQQQTVTPPFQHHGRHSNPHVSRLIAPASRQSAGASRASARRRMPTTGSDQPAKKQSKWSADEDAIIIELRGKGMKWEDISMNLPGRSAISCRLHYQNYLERRSEWDEPTKDKLAQLYERFKNKMWSEIAEELKVPWRAAEAWHWQLGEQEMARRAGTVPFTLAAVNAEMTAANRRGSPSRGQLSQSHSHLQSRRHGSVPPEMATPHPLAVYARSHPAPSGRPEPQTMAATSRRATAPPPPSRPAEHAEMPYASGPTIAPLQYQEHPETRPGPLPSIAELTTGINPYRNPYGEHAPPPPTHHGHEHQPPHTPYHGHEHAPSQTAYQRPEHAYATPGPGYAEPVGVKREPSPEELYRGPGYAGPVRFKRPSSPDTEEFNRQVNMRRRID